MLTNLKFLKKPREPNFHLCSKFMFFTKVSCHFSKMDIYKCPFSCFPFGLLKKMAILYNIFLNGLKEILYPTYI